MKTFAQKIKTGFDRIEAKDMYLIIDYFLRAKAKGGKPTYSITVEVEKKKQNKKTKRILLEVF